MNTQSFSKLIAEITRYQVLEVGGTVVTVGTLLFAAALLVATWIVWRIVHHAFEKVLEREDLRDPGTVRVVQRLAQFLVLLVGVGVTLETVGFDLTALFTAGAVVAVGLGFAMQNVAQNFVSGVILLVERTIKPGDALEVEGRVVRVTWMGIRATVVRTLDEEDIIIPNSILVQDSVKNFTLGDSLFRLSTTVGVIYGSDMALVRRVLEETATGMPWRHPDHEPRVLLSGFGESSVDFNVGVWIDDPWRARWLRSELHEAIWWAFKEAGITIAFPQLDVHLDPPVVESLQAVAAQATRIDPVDALRAD